MQFFPKLRSNISFILSYFKNTKFTINTKSKRYKNEHLINQITTNSLLSYIKKKQNL